jgi:hypothetical protein
MVTILLGLGARAPLTLIVPPAEQTACHCMRDRPVGRRVRRASATGITLRLIDRARNPAIHIVCGVRFAAARAFVSPVSASSLDDRLMTNDAHIMCICLNVRLGIACVGNGRRASGGGIAVGMRPGRTGHVVLRQAV